MLLTMNGEVKLADFGVSAKNKEDNQKRDTFIGGWRGQGCVMGPRNTLLDGSPAATDYYSVYSWINGRFCT